MSSDCAFRKDVDGHFGAGLAPAREHALREHLVGCDACRAYYERHALLAQLDPAALKAQERLARGLGLASPRRPWLTLPVAIPIGLAAAAAALLFVVGPLRTTPDDGFTARGGSAAIPDVEVRVYRVVAGKPQPVDASIPAEPELAFSYANRAGKKYLMIYGIDEHRHIYWFYPSWTDAAQDPAAIPAASSAGQTELPEAVTQKLDGQSLRLEALFLDQPATVKQIEARVAAGDEPIAGALRWSRELKVVP